MTIDLRSDTLTKPTPAMLEAMMNAQVGDDVFEEDPTVIALENKLAAMFGKEAGIFCPSGSMTNQIAIRISTQPQDEVICHKHSHVYMYEGGGMMSNSHVSVKLLEGERGLITAETIEENINADNVHFARTALVCLENTMNKGGGSCYDLKSIEAIKQVCTKNNLRLHLDGARIFNAIVAKGYTATEVGKYFDTISVCLSKGLGAPVGSVLLGTKAGIKHARRVRKSFGGGMRQVGFLAAAGIFALTHNIERLKIDHDRAQHIGQVLQNLQSVKVVYPVETNIIIFETKITADEYVNQLSTHGIKAAPFGKHAIRMVFHLDINDEMINRLEEILKKSF
ncbi:MAG: GntG family PLP-dependent aldolase [Bacteroidia bacterium]